MGRVAAGRWRRIVPKVGVLTHLAADTDPVMESGDRGVCHAELTFPLPAVIDDNQESSSLR